MFPNPQDALPLPPRPNTEQYRKLAKELVKACKSADPEALGAWAKGWVHDLVRLSGLKSTPTLPVHVGEWTRAVAEFATRKLKGESAERRCALADAQFVIARSHGFTSWPVLLKYIEGRADGDSSIAQFETAADAIVTGDAETVRRLLRENPKLATERSIREHGATLLHYVSANGVEGYRQKTPRNIVVIATVLLEAGADVNAEADVYGGGATTLGLAATSVHPEKAGVQEPLLQLLLDHGATIEEPNGRFTAVHACLANGRPQAAKFLAERGARLELAGAAALGSLDALKSHFNDDGTLKAPATHLQLQRGFLWACMYGREDAVRFLLERGAEVQDMGDTGGTGLHWAAGGGHVAIVKLLLERGAQLEVRNRWGGTVIEHTGWAFANADPTRDLIPVFVTLLKAGAKLQDGWLQWVEQQKRPAEVKARLVDVLKKHGAAT